MPELHDPASALAALLKTRGGPSPSSEALASGAPEALSLLEAALGRDPEVDERGVTLLRSLQSEAAARLLAGLAERSPSKGARKEARSALHRLRSRGISVPEVPSTPRAPAIWKPPPLPQTRGWLTTFDASWTRLAWLLLPRGGTSRVLLQGLLGEEGLSDLQALDLKASKVDEYFDAYRKELPYLKIAETGSEAPRRAIAQAAQASESKGSALPEAFLLFRDFFTAPAEPAGPGASAVEPPPPPTEEELKTLPEESAALLDLEEFGSWTLPVDRIAPILDKIRDSAESRVIVPKGVKQDRIAALTVESIDRLFPPAEHPRWAARLAEMAFVLDRLGKRRECRLALAASESLRRGGPPRPHPFFLALGRKTLAQSYAEAQEKEKSAPQIIARPG